jgi:hypothetical protein
MEKQWGVTIHQFGFSTFSPTPETLEITQLRKLAEEKLALFKQFRTSGLGTEAAVALISGSVVALRPVESEHRAKLPAPLLDGQPGQEPDELEQMLNDMDETDTPEKK